MRGLVSRPRRVLVRPRAAVLRPPDVKPHACPLAALVAHHDAAVRVMATVDRTVWYWYPIARYDGWEYDRLPPDLTPGGRARFGRDRRTILCLAAHTSRSIRCGRRLAHTGRHAHGDGRRIVAVWR